MQNRWLGLTFAVGILLVSVAEAATLTVVNTSDGAEPGPVGSLRRTIRDAAPGDVIEFGIPAGDPGCSGGVCTITLNSGDVFFAKPLTVRGPGAPLLRISGNDASRVFTIGQSGTVTLSGMTITRGNGVSSASSGFGGGLFSTGGFLNIRGCAFTDNSAAITGGAAIIAEATIDVTDTTFTGNTAPRGVIQLQDARGTILNSTISGNSAPQGSAGLLQLTAFSPLEEVLTLTNCTVTNNDGAVGGVRVSRGAGPATVRLQQTLVAANTGPNFFTDDATLTSDGSNFDSDGTSGFTNGVNGDQVGTSAIPLDARLAPLGDNGGGTATHALLAGSPAINAVTGTCPPPAEDQRGVPRAVGGICDIGAYESACGDGVIDFALGEQCDDGNGLGGDGCSAACEEEVASDCLGLTPTITGSGVLVGTNGRDVIAAKGGLNIILGNGGDDVICGGSGVDVIAGGPGVDVCDGGAGNDLQSGCETVSNVP